MKAYLLDVSIIPGSLKDSVTNLIGQHINQSVINGKYLDVHTMGEYIKLFDVVLGTNNITYPIGLKVNTYPNPTSGIINIAFSLSENNEINLSIYNVDGQLVQIIDQGKKTTGSYSYQVDLTNQNKGIYFLTLKLNKKKYSQKIIKN